MAIANIRQQLTQRILHNIKAEPGDIAASLITGQRDGISDDTNNAMRLSGLSHILSISGFQYGSGGSNDNWFASRDPGFLSRPLGTLSFLR
jgi:predicted membrane metal-binding protein